MDFEKYYTENILPKYGNFRNNKSDENLLSDTTNCLDDTNDTNQYDNVIDKERVDYTSLDVYSIDPVNCKDADDAFSIYHKSEKLYLAVHIADPTYYININTKSWNDILNRAITSYPSNNEPIHMLPDSILKKSSLMIDKDMDIESKHINAITITFEIDQNSYLPINDVKIEFTKITIKKENNFTYNQAGENLKNNQILQDGVTISQKMKELRSKKTIGTKLSELDFLLPVYINKSITFHESDVNEKLMKQMIAEFAIMVNSFIGHYINNNLHSCGIFRTCNSKFVEINNYVNAEDILDIIINNGVKAEYSSKISSHDLVGSEIYCHFTSPIRRVIDCVCHILIKSYYVNCELPWTKQELENISKHCCSISKREKNLQHIDYKFRILHLLSTMVNDNDIFIIFKINQYTGLFLNCNIYKIIIKNNITKKSKMFSTNLSYSLKNKNFNQIKLNSDSILIKVDKFLPCQKFDQGSLPDLDQYLFQHFLNI